MELTLDNIEQFSVPLKDFIGNWIFKDENEKIASQEHQDQIFILSKEAAKFLWDFDMALRIDLTEKYFKTISKFDCSSVDQQVIKKYLYNLGIPFRQKVFIAMEPDFGFILTWKMVIKYAHNLFWAHDQVVRDKTLNWALQFHHNDLFTFGNDLIYDGQLEKEKLWNALKGMNSRRNSFD